MLRTTFAAATLGIVLAGPAFAQQMTAQQFVTEAASGGMYEVKSSQFILDHAKAPAEVNDFAQRMVKDHSQANDKLKAIAQQEKLKVPAKMQKDQQQMMDKLQKAKDPSQTYSQQQLAAHKETVDLFQKYAKQGDNQQLQQFAQQTLPTLQEHLDMAQSLPAAK